MHVYTHLLRPGCLPRYCTLTPMSHPGCMVKPLLGFMALLAWSGVENTMRKAFAPSLGFGRLDGTDAEDGRGVAFWNPAYLTEVSDRQDLVLERGLTVRRAPT